MQRDNRINLFKEKGYYVIKEYECIDDSQETKDTRLRWIKNLQEDITSLDIKYKEKSFFDDIDGSENKIHIYYNEEKVEIYIAKSIQEYVKIIVEAVSDNKNHIYYRGHSNWKYLLKPSIYRADNVNILNNEDKLFRDIIASKPHFFNQCTTTLEKLVTMQHHELPTRLLDLTDNALISLYFACKYKENIHGEVTIFDVPEDKFKYYDSDTVSVLSNLAKSDIEFDVSDFNFTEYKGSEFFGEMISDTKLRNEYIDDFNKREEILQLVHAIREEKPYFLNKIDPSHLFNHTVVVKPKMSIDRIINQSGAFVLFGINATKSECSDLDINSEDYKQKIIIIPSAYKKGIIEQLKLFNINDLTVFGDMDNTAKYFKQKYLNI
ncbi:FRG domain-containing protein [Clostridium beijerinckii]|uniref:FRG domain-containing protein n=1 Tax=Clostridium beijerinckii TaxID=1520 RepID=UPI0022E709DE|nr:FRG domain-containing protein [Clostridium beijerinckii]